MSTPKLVRILIAVLFALLQANVALAQLVNPSLMEFPRFKSKPYWIGTHCGTGVTTAGNGDWIGVATGATGTALAFRVPWTGNVYGATIAQLGTTASVGRVAVTTNTAAFKLANGDLQFHGRFYIDQLSNSTDRYTLRVGLINSTSAESTVAVEVRYADNVNSGKFEVATLGSVTPTTIDTGVTAASQEYRIDIFINDAGTAGTVSINEAVVATLVSNNIPKANELGAGFFVLRSAGTAAANVFSCAGMELQIYPTTPLP